MSCSTRAEMRAIWISVLPTSLACRLNWSILLRSVPLPRYRALLARQAQPQPRFWSQVAACARPVSVLR